MQAIRVSVVIKALNEERHIGRALESSLRAVAKVGGEVILSDSHSLDRTVEIAGTYPVKIARLDDPSERCCGIGAQLGYQHAAGEFIYIMDGDMVMHEDFLSQAVACLEAHPEVAGVGGMVVEKNLESLEYQARVARAPANLKPGEVDRLDGGGLYRRAAIEQTGYLTDRNLHSYEEFDLGIRLRARGWTLRRIAVPAVDHYGHQVPAVELLLRRWRNGYVWGIGEVLRGALGQRHLGLLLRELRELHLYAMVLCWWLVLAGLWLLPVALGQKAGLFLGILVFPMIVMALRKRSLSLAVYSIFSWSVSAAGLLRGFLRPRRAAAGKIRAEMSGPAGQSAA